MKKIILGTALAGLSTLAIANQSMCVAPEITQPKTSVEDSFAKKKYHWVLAWGFYEKGTTNNQRFEYTYVKQEYCYQAALDEWRNYWSDSVLNTHYNLVTICRSRVDSSKFKRIECDVNMSCNI